MLWSPSSSQKLFLGILLRLKPCFELSLLLSFELPLSLFSIEIFKFKALTEYFFDKWILLISQYLHSFPFLYSWLFYMTWPLYCEIRNLQPPFDRLPIIKLKYAILNCLTAGPVWTYLSPQILAPTLSNSIPTGIIYISLFFSGAFNGFIYGQSTF